MLAEETAQEGKEAAVHGNDGRLQESALKDLTASWRRKEAVKHANIGIGFHTVKDQAQPVFNAEVMPQAARL